MTQSIVVYRLLTASAKADDMNLSYQTMQALRNMGIVKPRHDLYEVIRSDTHTITVYYYEKV